MNKNETYFDEFGRCIPEGLSNAVHQESRRYFLIKDVDINYSDIFNRIKKHLGSDGGITLEEFETRSKAILDGVNSDPQTKNITNGIAVPFFIPQNNSSDIGKSLVENYLIALKNSFQELNPEYEFIDHCTEDLTGNIKVSSNTRHQDLVDRLKQETIVGVYFPSLLEYSIPACIERLKSLPSNFLLAGAFDTSAAFIGYPNLLLREDGYPPMLWMSAIEGPKPGIGYHIEAYGYNLTFNRRPHLGDTAEYWAHALTVLG